MAFEFRKRMNEQTGLRLPTTLVFNYPTLAALAALAALARHLDGNSAARACAGVRPRSDGWGDNPTRFHLSMRGLH